MDRAQLLNDAEEAMRLTLDGRQSCMWTALPGIVKSVDFDAMTCEVQPTIQGTVEDESGAVQSVNLPLLVDVPICFPNSNGFMLTFPLASGDEVLVVMASRCIDAWWQSGGIQRPMEARMHDLSDGFAIPGPRSQPRVVSDISSSEAQLRNTAGTTYLSITASGKIGFQNATTDLKGILTDLQAALNTFVTTLAALPPAAPVLGAAIATPAATAVTALIPILVKIGALLK